MGRPKTATSDLMLPMKRRSRSKTQKKEFGELNRRTPFNCVTASVFATVLQVRLRHKSVSIRVAASVFATQLPICLLAKLVSIRVAASVFATMTKTLNDQVVSFNSRRCERLCNGWSSTHKRSQSFQFASLRASLQRENLEVFVVVFRGFNSRRCERLCNPS